MNPRYPHVAERAGHRCEYCRAPEVIFNLPFELEHIVPSSQSGGDEDGNLALACRACNLHKSDHQDGPDEITATSPPLFNPRSDVWEQHFQVNRVSGEIEGSTPIGRGTISRLRMNSSAQSLARLQWIRLGLFP